MTWMVPDLVLSIEKRIGDGPAAVARDPGCERHLLANEVFDEDLGAGQPSERSDGVAQQSSWEYDVIVYTCAPR